MRDAVIKLWLMIIVVGILGLVAAQVSAEPVYECIAEDEADALYTTYPDFVIVQGNVMIIKDADREWYVLELDKTMGEFCREVREAGSYCKPCPS